MNPQTCPQLSLLKRPEESNEDFAKINDPDEFLLRWLNFHLKRSETGLPEVRDFGSDLRDGKALTVLLHELDPIRCLETETGKPGDVLVETALGSAFELGVPRIFTKKDVLGDNEFMNKELLAELFALDNGLPETSQEGQELRKAVVRILNEKLKGDEDLKDVIPINPGDESLFKALKDGVVLGYLPMVLLNSLGFIIY